MFKFLKKKKIKGQSTLEYAVLIIIIIGALLSIQVYIKRAVSGGLRKSADDIGEQFSPGNTNYTMTTSTFGVTLETYNVGVQRSDLEVDESTNTTYNQRLINVDQEFWG